jgi:hypothetical protein
LNTQPENDTVKFLRDIAKETLSNGFVTKDEQLSWSDEPRVYKKNCLKSQSILKRENCLKLAGIR